MVITRLSGGLGNQLFQYAAGRALSLSRSVPLALDISLLNQRSEGVTPRSYGLDAYNIVASIASPDDVARLTTPALLGSTTLGRVANKLSPISSRTYYYERSHAFDPNVAALGSEVYLAGHWQSEKYFQSAASSIRREVTLARPLSAGAERLASEIASVRTPVSVHVRRGDYTTNPHAANYHGVLGVEYYEKALSEISAADPDAHFFVFSDDPAWARQNIGGGRHLTVVERDSRKDAEDLVLLSRCVHHVISNSSFSWWGAWLSTAPGKRVVAPQRWFADPSADSSDLIPAGWTRI